MDEFWLENRRGAMLLGIGESSPRLSWRFGLPIDTPLVLACRSSVGNDVEIAVPASAHMLGWPMRDLISRERVDLIWRAADRLEPQAVHHATVEAGLLSTVDWHADFASPSPRAPASAPRPAYLIRARWSTDDLGLRLSDIARVRLYSTAHGAYELVVNGMRVDADVLAPGWTSYRHRLRYRTHDLTAITKDGVNTVGAWLADGWYRGRIGFDGGRWDWYGHDVALCAQLEISTVDGRLIEVALSPWKWHTAPVTAVGLYEGERHDATLDIPGWSEPGFDDSNWEPCTVLPRSSFSGRIEAPTAAPVEICDTLTPVDVTSTADGRIRVDFGQNIAGKLRIRPRGERGRAIRLHHAEMLAGDQLATRPLRTATSIDEYVCSGEENAAWSPRFTLHGFRYAELENWPGGIEQIKAASEPCVEAQVVHTRMLRTGWFECSEDLINRLHENVVWSMRSNFVDLPTDCPQRDERCGWTGDIQIFVPTALFLFDCRGTLTGWLRDLACEQADKGHVPNFVPWIDCGFPDFPTAGWGDAAVVVPWEMYKHDGDDRVLRDQYVSMTTWVDLVDSLTGRTGLWDHGFQLGDWLDPEAPPDDPAKSRTDKGLLATAYHVRTSRIVAATARLLGRDQDAARYAAMADRTASAFLHEYVSPAGRIVSDTATALAVSISFDLLADSGQRTRAGQRLAELVADNGYRISSGFLGTPAMCEALTRTGHVEAAYRLLLQEECPSWLYPVTMGATTIWERWDSLLPDGSVNPGGMTSFNHYALGAVADFLHSAVAGLRRLPTGGPDVLFAPLTGGTLSSARAEHDSPWGVVGIDWEVSDGRLDVTIRIPDGVRGQVLLPGDAAPRPLPAGRHHLKTATSENAVRQQARAVDALVRGSSLPI